HAVILEGRMSAVARPPGDAAAASRAWRANARCNAPRESGDSRVASTGHAAAKVGQAAECGQSAVGSKQRQIARPKVGGGSTRWGAPVDVEHREISADRSVDVLRTGREGQ